MKKRMTSSSRKSKGRRLAQAVREEVLKAFPQMNEEDCTVTPSGVNGPDVVLTPAFRKDFPFSIECKNNETISMWAAIKQAKSHLKPDMHPMLVIARNRQEPWICMPMESFFNEFYPSPKIETAVESVESVADQVSTMFSVPEDSK